MITPFSWHHSFEVRKFEMPRLIFQCNKNRVMDYPNIWGYVRDILHIPGVKDTVDQEHIQKHYQVQ